MTREQMVLNRWVTFGFAILFAVLGCFLLPMSLVGLINARQSVGWPTVEGRVLESRIEDTTIYQRSKGAKPYYEPHVVYAYTIDGTEYENDEVSFSERGGSTDRKWAQSIVSSYRTGEAVTIYYKPSDPSDSVLEPGVDTDCYVMIAIGVGCFIFGGVLYLLSWNFKRQLASS